jgi:DNA repair protein RecO
MIVTTEAVIVKSLKYRDTSKILTAYTEAFGRCSVIANGARKPKNKFGSALEVGACSVLTFYKHPNKDLHTLQSAETAHALRRTMDSFDKLTVALSMLEAVSSTQHDEEPRPALYGFLRESLRAVNDCEANEQTILFWFQLHLAEALGFALRPQVCASSDDEISPAMAPEFLLSLADGAPFAPEFNLLASARQDVFKVDAGTLAVLQHLARLHQSAVGSRGAYNALASQGGLDARGLDARGLDAQSELGSTSNSALASALDAASRLALQPRQQQQLGDFFALYYQYHIERNITGRTRRFLRDV